MDNLFESKQCANAVEMLCNRLICISCKQACKLTCFLSKSAVSINRNYDRNFRIIFAYVIVLNTVARSCMNAACTAFQSNVVANNYKGFSVEERMLSLHVFKLNTLHCAYNFVILFAGFLHCISSKCFCHYIVFITAFDDGIIKIRSKANCNVTRKCPCSCCPNYKIALLRFNSQSLELALIVINLKFYVDRMTWVFCVLNFCFCKSCLTVRAPVNRLQALVDVTLASHLCKNFNLLCLKLRKKSDIRIIPLAYNAKTFKLISLVIKISQSKLTANLSYLQFGNCC